jgi:MoxR-like ATPase
MTASILSVPKNGVATEGVTAPGRTRSYLNAVLRGKSEVVEQVLICLLAQGHLLIEDKPGLGKTTLAKALAVAVGGRFARVQCTPDLLPGDITGFSIYNQKAHEFEFRPGPVFSEVLLADEINRATPRTQSALLEAMAERQVTVDAVRYPLSQEFFVIATQNPIDQHGTFPLPEAQLDRFAMKLSVGYPHPKDELQMLRDAAAGTEALGRQEALFPEQCLRHVQQQVARLVIADPIQEYLVQLADASRRHPQVVLGVSPRGLLTWQRVAQARAFLNQRAFVTPDDVQQTAIPVLCVRLGIDHSDPLPVIREILDSVPVPEYRVQEIAS